MSETPLLHLRLLGPVEASVNGVPVAINSRAARRILGVLALSPNQSLQRGRLAALLWDRSDEARARQNLRQALHGLRAALEPAWCGLSVGRGHVGIHPGTLRTDVEDLLAVVEDGAPPRATAFAHWDPARLLEVEAEVEDSALFSSWVRLRQREHEARLVDALQGVLERGSVEDGITAAEALLRIDTTDERAARYLMRAYHAQGETARAHTVYDTLWAHLEEMHDSEPAQETQDLIAAVKLGQVEPQTPAAPRTGFRLALGDVAPSGKPQTDAIARLFRAELAALLMRFRALEVVDQPNGAAAGIDYRLELTAGETGGRSLLVAMLVRHSDGSVIWTDRSEALAENWISTQAGLLTRIAAALSDSLSRARLAELNTSGVTPAVVDDWLLGNMALDRFDAQGLAAAERHFRRMIDAAPDASQGYSSLARLMNGAHLMVPGRMRRTEDHLQAKVLGARAVALDPLDSRAHLHRGWASALLGEHDQAAVSFAMARDCNPADPWTLLSSALGAGFGGDRDLSLRLAASVLDQGWTTAPFQWGFHAPVRFLAGDDAGCVAAAEAGGRAIPNLLAWKATALWHQGETDAARRVWQAFSDHCAHGWSGAEPHGRRAVLMWFLSLFPIARDEDRARLEAGATGAAGL